jgi:hydrogenase maturation protein HypF
MRLERLKCTIRGAVQGVGFRPFVYRLATSLNLSGWVLNTGNGVTLEAEGQRPALLEFLKRLESEKPVHAILQSLEFSFLQPVNHTGFSIRESEAGDGKCAFILPDIAPCAECLAEIFDPANRRYRYPFTNCTHCGPRFSIIHSLPYDRPNTSMKAFVMCPLCAAEYHNPADRRFHAQPNACPACGPQLTICDALGQVSASGEQALQAAVAVLQQGQILAVKGMGGFQLMVDARNDGAVVRLRERKRREEKPFALAYPTLDAVRADCQVDELEARLLCSPEAPIVILDRRGESGPLAHSVAPRNPHLGVMLPSTPLHYLLLRDFPFPVVATSGNLSHEPICIDNAEALDRLGNIADFFLVHNRPIVQPVDDSVARIMLGREMLLRRARGYAPLPIHLNQEVPPTLAVGPHLKNTIALGIGQDVFLSQHLGDLEGAESWSTYQRTAAHLQHLYDFQPEIVACDLHPEYISTQYGRSVSTTTVSIQHHYAHVLSCMAENEIDGPVLGVAWDGTGLGLDGTIWGGEFLLVDSTSSQPASDAGFTRLAHLRTFRLPGGDAAVQQPRRSALGLLWEIYGEELFERDDTLGFRRQFTDVELRMLRQMLVNNVNCPVTSSAGRLFDGVASLVGLRHRVHYEGQAAAELEDAVAANVTTRFPFKVHHRKPMVLDWQPTVLRLLDGVSKGKATGLLAAEFHQTLAEMILTIAKTARVEHVALTGGCFQNRCLLEKTEARLRQEKFRPVWHQRVPSNDGGIALGQIVGAARAAAARRAQTEECFA